MKFFYYEFMKKACDEAIAQAENGLYYVEPAFRVILSSEDLTPENVVDYEVSWSGIKEYLELEVKKLNTMQDKMPAVLDRIHQIITTTIEPSMLEEENEMTKNLIEYMRMKKEAQ